MEARGKQIYGVGMVWLLVVIEGAATSLCIIQMESLIILILPPSLWPVHCLFFFKTGTSVKYGDVRKFDIPNFQISIDKAGKRSKPSRGKLWP